MVAQLSSALRILRRRQVEARVGLKRSTLYDRIKNGSFPAPIELGGGRAVGWIESEIDAWLAAQIEKSRNVVAKGGAQ